MTKARRVEEVASLVIAGTEGMVVSYAKCCYPLPGDDVMGYLTAGRGVVIHRNNCGNLSNFRKQPEKWIAVSWEKDVDREFPLPDPVRDTQPHRRAGRGRRNNRRLRSNIEQVEVISRHEDCLRSDVPAAGQDRIHLAQIMRNVRKMPNVIRVSRDCA